MVTTTATTTMMNQQQQQASKPIAIPSNNNTDNKSYREIIKQLAAQQTTKPYGDIPPMRNKKKTSSSNRPKSTKASSPENTKEPQVRQKALRRMSHVEDWIVVDSKESLPDEEELVQSPLRNFLSADFFTEVLPLHMPPPSLSERYDIQIADDALDEEEEEDEEDDDEEQLLSTSWKSQENDETSSKNLLLSVTNYHKDLLRRHSVSSFHNIKSSPTSSSTTTTASYAVSSSPPHLSNTDHELWKATIAKLKRTLIVSPPTTPPVVPEIEVAPPVQSQLVIKKTNKKKLNNKFIPMPIPPRRPISQKRRSEATTQPRFNPDTNTYTRDTRSNPDHLRMISAELNMMRGRKLLSPLKPRGFLPRRKDAFVTGFKRKQSHLIQEVIY